MPFNGTVCVCFVNLSLGVCICRNEYPIDGSRALSSCLLLMIMFIFAFRNNLLWTLSWISPSDTTSPLHISYFFRGFWCDIIKVLGTSQQVPMRRAHVSDQRLSFEFYDTIVIRAISSEMVWIFPFVDIKLQNRLKCFWQTSTETEILFKFFNYFKLGIFSLMLRTYFQTCLIEIKDICVQEFE